MSGRMLGLFLVAAMLSTTSAAAGDDNWRAYLRLAGVFPEEKSDYAIPYALAPNDLKLDNNVLPEVGFAYFLNRRLSLELSILCPSRHKVTVSSTGLIAGHFDQFPVALVCKHYFRPDKELNPYVALGLNHTWFTDVSLTMAPGLSMDEGRFGAVISGGFDKKLNDRAYLNVDVKKMWSKSDIMESGAKITNIRVDPLIIGIGVGWKL